MDLVPTFAAIANANAAGLKYDGMDLSPRLFRGESLPNRELFWRMKDQKAVRRGPWKLVAEKRNQIELYDLENDLGEQNDLAEKKPELVTELRRVWDLWEADVNRSAAMYNGRQRATTVSK